MPGTKIYYISGPGRNRVGGISFNGSPITWQSQPVYDTWGPNFGGYWMCAEWMAWHQELEKKYGRQDANLIWYQAWNQQSSLSGPQNCKWDSTFTNYLINVGLLDPNEWAMILPTIVKDAGEVITSTTGAAATISKLIKPVAFLVLIGAGVWAYKKYVK